MPQEFLVVRCYSCQTFQIHQTRRDGKFVCKICGVKQSRKKVYAQGNSKDCRVAVQNLNAQMQLNFDEEIPRPLSEDEEPVEELENTDHTKPLESKWDDFLEPQNDSLDDEDETSLKNCKISEIDSKESSSRVNMQVSEMDSEEATSRVDTRFVPSSFTKVKRFHTGEIKNKTNKEPEEENKLIENKDCMKENAIEKFQNVDDKYLDILNTSFSC